MVGPTDPTNANDGGTAAVDTAAAIVGHPDATALGAPAVDGPVDNGAPDEATNQAYEEAIARARQALRDDVDLMAIP